MSVQSIYSLLYAVGLAIKPVIQWRRWISDVSNITYYDAKKYESVIYHPTIFGIPYQKQVMVSLKKHNVA